MFQPLCQKIFIIYDIFFWLVMLIHSDCNLFHTEINYLMQIDANSAVLIGGKSKRIGFDKAFLRLGDEYVTERLIRLLCSIFSSVCFIASTKKQLPVTDVAVYFDRESGLGPLSGLLTALQSSDHDYSFVVPCDMPFIQSKLIEVLWQHKFDSDIIIPYVEDRAQPLVAFYHRRCIPHIEQALRGSDRHMLSFHANLNIQRLQMETFFKKEELDRMFFNVNLPEDYSKAIEIDNKE